LKTQQKDAFGRKTHAAISGCLVPFENAAERRVLEKNHAAMSGCLVPFENAVERRDAPTEEAHTTIFYDHKVLTKTAPLRSLASEIIGE
jgi:hypothetical protein